ncbi:ROK family protein [Paenibacillus beijingensis]|uniref:ROK family transcriptional regulator n=1 Tax=Paenibacillus beijingensis TaxID=1126833 RepID=A0A0D5NHD1_9BACL|nr:ROK family protein [Paenibacillus beijingensis]AJY74323.1 ROK family transcriptional regulator [Paenibacillus beijingensis]
MEYAIGVDIGGTKIQFAAVDPNGQLLHKHLVPTEAQLGPNQVMEKLKAGIDHIIAALQTAESYVGIGIGSAGQIDFQAGTVVFAGDTLPGWTGMQIKSHVEERFHKPVYVDNDVNVIAVAEKVYGAGQDYASFVCLALGTGIGGAIVESGQLVRGAFGGAGELGHVSVDFNGPRCGCGNYGCIELYASGTGIARLGRETLAASRGKASWEPQSRDIIQAWQRGDPLAGQVMDQVIRALGTAVAGFIHSFNPEAVILGGGMSETGLLFFEALDNEVQTRTSPGMRKACRLLPAYVGADAGVIGAAAQVWHYRGNR